MVHFPAFYYGIISEVVSMMVVRKVQNNNNDLVREGEECDL